MSEDDVSGIELEGSPGNSTGECGCAGLLKLNYRDIADGVGLTAGFLKNTWGQFRLRVTVPLTQ